MYMHEQLPSRTVTTACYGEEPNGTSTMDLSEKILINLLFPDVDTFVDTGSVVVGSGFRFL
jgi:hypothetical protein